MNKEEKQKAVELEGEKYLSRIKELLTDPEKYREEPMLLFGQMLVADTTMISNIQAIAAQPQPANLVPGGEFLLPISEAAKIKNEISKPTNEPVNITVNSVSDIDIQEFEYRLANIDFSGHTRKPYSDNEKTS